MNKGSPNIEYLKNAAVLKLWYDRGFRDIKFDVPLTYNGKKLIVKVLAKNSEGVMFGVECVSSVRLERLQKRIALLRGCLPPNSYIIAVFPQTAGDRVKKVVKLADEVWITGKNGKVEQMMFMSFFHKE